MVICCVPQCRTDSLNCDSSVTFHEFPSSPDIAAKWIKQINIAIQSVPMWIPRGKVLICSKHFLQTDFKDNSDALKPRSIPAVFGHRYIGVNAEITQPKNEMNKPLIVKVIRTEDSVLENDNNIEITEVYSTVCENSSNEAKGKSWNHSSKIKETINYSKNSKMISHPSPPTNRVNYNVVASSTTTPHTKKVNTCTATSFQNSSNPTELTSGVNGTNIKTKAKRKLETTPRVYSRKRQKANNDLIEIGPNTFLKINPDVIKVNRKLTPSGNTVLQFLMDQKYANSQGSNMIPKVIQGPFTLPEANSNAHSKENHPDSNKTVLKSSINKGTKIVNSSNLTNKKCSNNTVVQHVLGHLIDTHDCQELCNDLELAEDDPNINKNIIEENTKEDVLIYETVKEKQSNILPKKIQLTSLSQNTSPSSVPSHQRNASQAKNAQPGSLKSQNIQPSSTLSDASELSADSNVLANAPILLTTKNPISHCFADKPKFLLQLREKNRQLAAMRLKMTSLTQKIEELEDKCIVQDRQLSYTFIKKLKSIRKSSTKGDPAATYILELIRCYSSNVNMRWSDSTLAQCAIWVKKAPYAYEYFKKADLFKLPALPTVKRFIKKHPDIIEMQKRFNKKEGDDDSSSSSDFDFDESGNENEELEYTALNENTVACETILTEVPETTEQAVKNEPITVTEDISHESIDEQNISTSSNAVENTVESPEKNVETGTPITLDSSNLELQEIILPSGEVLQCYSSTVNSGKDAGQYFIIPNASLPNSAGENEYSVVQADSLPAFLQNYVRSEPQTKDQELVYVESTEEQEKIIETVVSSGS